MWWWQRGCCGVCGHLVHPLAVLVLSTPLPHTLTHTRGGGHVVVVAVCVVWLPPPLCPIPTNHHHCVRCPALSAVCACAWWHQAQRRTVVAPTLVCVCVAVCAPCPPHPPPTLSTLVASLSSLSPSHTCHSHSHTWHASRHTHTWRALCASSHPLTHTGCLTAHTPDTHTRHWVCVRPSTCSHPPPLTHTRDAQAWRMHGWLGVWSPPPRPLCPPLTLTHTAGLVVGAMVVRGGVGVGCVCLPRHQPPRHPSHHHHQRSCATTAHTHGTWWMHHCHTHTPHAPPHSPTRAVWCPHHATHSHTPPATHPQWCLPSLTTLSTHTPTQRMPHTHHTGEGPRARTPVGVAFGEPPPPRWSWAFAVLCWWLLVHQPLFTLTHPFTPTPSSPNHHHHHPIHPACVVCVVWERTAPGTTVVVKHATHTPVVHCVCSWLTPSHPSSTTHPPSCAFPTTNHHPFPLLHSPSPSHTHHKATVVIHCPLFCLTHTHGVGGMWLCGCSLVLCV